MWILGILQVGTLARRPAQTYLTLYQVATIYCGTFQQFLAVRALFGLFMGGVYGSAIAMALENCPVDARGLMSGILQQGYSMGYVLAACANLGNTTLTLYT